MTLIAPVPSTWAEAGFALTEPGGEVGAETVPSPRLAQTIALHFVFTEHLPGPTIEQRTAASTACSGSRPRFQPVPKSSRLRHADLDDL